MARAWYPPEGYVARQPQASQTPSATTRQQHPQAAAASQVTSPSRTVSPPRDNRVDVRLEAKSQDGQIHINLSIDGSNSQLIVSQLPDLVEMARSGSRLMEWATKARDAADQLQSQQRHVERRNGAVEPRSWKSTLSDAVRGMTLSKLVKWTLILVFCRTF